MSLEDIRSQYKRLDFLHKWHPIRNEIKYYFKQWKKDTYFRKKIYYMTYIEKIYSHCYKILTKTEMEIQAIVMYPCFVQWIFPVLAPLLGSFNGPQPGGIEKRKRLISLGLFRGPIKSLTQDLHRSWRHQAPSRGGLRNPGRKVSMTGLHTPESQPEKERERKRERDKKDLGT